MKRIISMVIALTMAITPMTAFGASTNNCTGECTHAAKIGGTHYDTLQEAVTAGGDVVLLKDVIEDITVEGTVSIDLNGFDITASKDHTLYNKGTLTVKGEGVVTNNVKSKGALFNEGTATLNGGTFTGNTWYVIKNLGTLNIDGTTVTQEDSGSSGIANGYYGNEAGYGSLPADTKVNLHIKSGSFSGGMNTIKNDDYGIAVIDGGTFSNTDGPTVLNWNEATINGGSFTVNDIAKSVIANGHLNVVNDQDKGELTINGGTFVASEEGTMFGYGQSSTTGGEVVINDGDFDGTIITTDYPYTPEIKGGLYSDDVSEYVSETKAYASITSNGATVYCVSKAKIEGTVKAGDIVTVLSAGGETLSLNLANGVTVKNESGADITVNGSTVATGETITSYEPPETPSEVTDAMIEAMQIPDVSDIGFDADDKAAIDNAREAYEKAIATNPAYEAILAPTLEKIEAAEAAYVAAKRTAFEATEPDIELDQDEFYYNKKAKTPDVVSGLEAFTEGTDYEITYVDNIKAGIGSVVIEGKGDLEGFSVSKDILIRPYKGVINKVTTKRNSMVVTSRDQSAGGITGYQFAWRVTNSGDDWKTKMTSTKNYKTTIKKLKANTRYTVKVRGIVKVDGVRYYGDWSKLKKVRTAR